MESKNYPSWRYNEGQKRKKICKDEADDAENFKPEDGWSGVPYHEPVKTLQHEQVDNANKVLGDAHTVIEEAQKERKRILDAAEADADATYDRIVDRAQEHADKIVSVADDHAAKVVAEAKQTAEQIVAEAKQTAEQILAEANAKALVPKEDIPVKTKGSK